MKLYYYILNRVTLVILALATILDGLILLTTLGFYLPKFAVRAAFWRISLKSYRHTVIEKWKPKDNK